ncbi:enoyl-CoA hydratase/isomerase family protein [Leptospira sp. 'Mane']|uniref:enoyl-CoA hydratase/isomerase family protein n=1 Tax=Leptospira sp. 'Mane' TaxID=3387407 RepID=UPI00398B992F
MIHLKIEEEIATITLDTNESNSFTLESFQKLNESIKEAESQLSKVLILRSARAGIFSQGLNLTELSGDKSKESLDIFLHYFFGILERVYTFPGVVIAEVGGHAMGYGAMLAIASDFRFGLEGTRIGLPEVKIGIRVPSFVALMLRNIIGAREADSHIIQGNAYKASEAQELGLYDESFTDANQLKESVVKLARKLTKNSFGATKASKEALRYLNGDLQKLLDYDKEKTLESLYTEDALEGIAAAVAGRRPQFK